MARWIVLLCVFVALVVAGVVGVSRIMSWQGWMASAGASTVDPSVFGAQQPSASSASPAAAPTPAPDPVAACLASALNAVPPTGTGTLTGEVIGLQSGAVLWDDGAAKPRIPASGEKLLTSLALVDTLGPDALATTYKTTVVAGADDKIVLVGGGDPLLASTTATATLGQPQTLADLAAATAKALLAAGRTSVSLGFDDTAFTGPDWQPTWDPGYVYDVTRISALWVDEGLTPLPATTPEGSGTRSQTPALSAAEVFASQLKADGVDVTAVDSSAAAAPSGAAVLASIDSLTLGDIIKHTLLISDNSVAEVLLRHLAIAKGLSGSFDDGAKALMDWLSANHLSQPDLTIVDGSGLSRQNAVPAATLAGAVAWATAKGGAAATVVSRLPVSGYSGTLTSRFLGADASGARGFVHAKTGSMDNVSSLTGYTVTAKGQWLAFSVIVNDGPVSQWTMQTWLDQVVATMTTSQC